MATAELEGGTIVLPKRISLAIAVGFVAQLGYVGYHVATTQASTSGDIERLKRDVAAVSQINERTIRMEEQLVFIKSALERQARAR
jgi:hypothetical protein